MARRTKDHSIAVAWEYRVGERPNTVTAYERLDRKRTIELRWWMSDLRRYRRKGLGIRIRDESGAIAHDLERRAMILTQDWYDKLRAESKPKRIKPDTRKCDSHALRQPRRPDLTLVQGFDLATHVGTGMCVVETRHLKDVCRAVRDLTWAIGISRSGVPRTWSGLNYSAVREIWIKLAQRYAEAGKGGPAWTERCVVIFLQVNRWLTGKGLTKRVVPVKKTWREQLRQEWEQLTGSRITRNVPQHSADEIAKIFSALSDDRVDPRVALAVELVADARLGQLRRLTRADVDLGPVGVFSLGRVVVHGSGKKLGVGRDLTPRDRAAIDRALDGYLRDLEWLYQAGLRTNYPMFPAGRLRFDKESPRWRTQSGVSGEGQVRRVRPDVGDKVIGKSAITDMFHELELIAGVQPIPGRGWYGIRRRAADFSKHQEL